MQPVTTFKNMADLRVEIDALDGRIVTLLAQRAKLIAQAVVLKPAEGLPARIDSRVDAVIDNVTTKAQDQGLDPDLVETLWREMIEWSIRLEEKTLGTATTTAPSQNQSEETGL